MKTDINYDELSPGIRGAVKWLRDNGFNTCDSGDGSNFEQGMECAWEQPMVIIAVSREKLLSEADRLLALLEAEGVPLTPQGGDDPHEPQDCVMVDAVYLPAQNGRCIISVVEIGERGLLATLGKPKVAST